MPSFIRVRGLSSRALLSASFLCAGLTLAACGSDEEVTASGSSFSQALFKDYTDLATQAESAPAPQAQDTGFFSDIVGIFGGGPENPADAVADAFRSKANQAAGGGEPDPEAAPADPTAQSLRGRLVAAVARGKDSAPDQAARAQADYDCWVLDSGASNLISQAQACRTALGSSLLALENVARPAAPALPPPVATAPLPSAPPSAPAPSAPVPQAATPAPEAAAASPNYTVYFDFDSWTLTAEDLSVVTNVINTARAGRQSHITVVGHTDTSGSAAYNQRLSVRRANVVVEALVDMGARRAAIQASGVGKTDLAVPTPDGVKEARNRRSVISLIP